MKTLVLTLSLIIGITCHAQEYKYNRVEKHFKDNSMETQIIKTHGTFRFDTDNKFLIGEIDEDNLIWEMYILEDAYDERGRILRVETEGGEFEVIIEDQSKMITTVFEEYWDVYYLK